MAAVANPDRGYLDFARENFSYILPAATKGAIALREGFKTATVIVISGIGGQILAKNITHGEPSSATFENALENKITISEALQEVETGFGRVAAAFALALLTAMKISKEASIVNRLGFAVIGITTFNVLMNSQIVGKTLSYLSGETIDPTDTFGRNLPSMMGIAIDPLVSDHSPQLKLGGSSNSCFYKFSKALG